MVLITFRYDKFSAAVQTAISSRRSIDPLSVGEGKPRPHSPPPRRRDERTPYGGERS